MDDVGSREEVVVDLGARGFELATPIGRVATVYRAYQPAFRRHVAIKLLHAARGDTAALARFERERAAIGSVSSHPHIVTVYESGFTHDDTPYLAMEYLPNGSLADRAAAGPVPWHEAVEIARKLASALAFAHAKGVLHCDVKPENVLLSAFDEPQLADFGIARIVGGTDAHSAQAHLLIPHAPPEVLQGDPPSERSDVYGLASTVMTLMLGHPPYHRDGETSFVPMFGRILNDPVPDLRALDVPEPIAAAFEAALAKHPADRQASAESLLSELDIASSSALQESVSRRAAKREALLRPPHVDLSPDPIVVVADVPPSGTETEDAPLRPPPSPRPSRGRLGLLAGAVAGVVVLVLAIAALDSDDAPTNTAARRPASRVPAVTTAPPTTAAGTEFRSATFPVPVRVRLPEGWTRGTEQPGLVELVPSGGGGRVTLVAPQRVLDPARPFTTPQSILPAFRDVPADLAGWFGANRRVRVIGAEPVTTAGVAGTRLSLDVTGAYAYPGCGGRPCVLAVGVGEFPGQPVPLFAGEQHRIDVLSVAGRAVLVVTSSPDLAAFAPRADAVLSTLAFG